MLLAVLAVNPAQHPALAAKAPAVHACGPLTATHSLVEPLDVQMWKAPLDASGDRELILAAHADGARFCYRYTWNGVAQTGEPTIRVRRGERFAIRIVNDLSGQSAGEKVASTAIPACMPMMRMEPAVQHWTGYLNHPIDDRFFHAKPIDTNLHLHGFQGPASQEDVFLSTLSTPMHACEYRITIPRTQPPGAYLYHPHAHGSSDVQLAGGLAGVWIVEPDAPQIARADEHVLLLRYRIPFANDYNFSPDEATIANDGAAHEAALAAASPVPYDPFNPPAWPVTFPMHGGGVTLDPTGCSGAEAEALISVDGAIAPATLAIPTGRTQLLRIVNVTSDTAKLLQLRDGSGHAQPFLVAALDGVPVSGDMEHPLAHTIAMNDLMLSPMSRADVLLTATPGETFVLSSGAYCGGKDAFFEIPHDLVHIAATGPSGQAQTARATPIAPADTPAARLVAFARAHPSSIRRRAVTFSEYNFAKRGSIPEHPAYYITDTTDPDFREHPFWPDFAPDATVPSNADIVVKQGTIEEWYLINTTMESHAFHIHQMAFVQERTDLGMPVTSDTVFVPVGKLRPNPHDPNYPLVVASITKVILDFRHVPKGTFVYHCHMLYHEDRGMMGVIRVE
jgi:FtsP/CotA-like multicopper oxidase with cupredoxin domain